MYMRTLGNFGRGDADHLSIFAYRFADSDLCRRDLMSGGNCVDGRHMFAGEPCSRCDAPRRNDDVVRRMQAYRNGIMGQDIGQERLLRACGARRNIPTILTVTG